MNCKTNTIIAIDWQPFQHSVFLLRIFIILTTFPIPTPLQSHKQQQHQKSF